MGINHGPYQNLQPLLSSQEEGDSLAQLSCALEQIGLPGEGNYPLVEKWVEYTLSAFHRRAAIEELVRHKPDSLLEMGIPKELIPITCKWATEGPIILSTFSHPGELDIYEDVATLGLAMTVRSLRGHGIGIPPNRIIAGCYDTVCLHRSALRPFTVDGIDGEVSLFPKDEYGPEVHEQAELDPKRIRTRLQTISHSTVAKRIHETALRQTLVLLTKNPKLRESLMGNTPSMPFRELETILKEGLRRRVAEATKLMEEALNACDGYTEPRISQFLVQLKRNLGLQILAPVQEIMSENSLAATFGFQERLSSDDDSYKSLVLWTLQTLTETYGTDFLRKLASPWKEMFIGTIDGRVVTMVMTDNRDVILMDRKTYECIKNVEPGEEVVIAEKYGMVPKAELELLAMVAGGTTFHMGSEYGLREKIIGLLPVPDVHANYIRALRIGGDKEQGNEVLELAETGNPIPPLLALTLLGKNYIREKILQVAGRDSRPIQITRHALGIAAIQNLLLPPQN